MPHTRGFRFRERRTTHFQRHGGDFGSTSALEYEAAADAFLGEPICQTTHPTMSHCIRLSSGDLLRYDENTHHFGVLAPDGYIKTFYIPDTARHGFPTDFEYFIDEIINQ